MRLKFLDFFSGIGGFRLGMEMAGHECVGHCEWDKFANMSYINMHKPKEGEWYGEDIRKVRAEELPRADVWCFGFPCQDISIAGHQRGFEGNRSSLFFTVTRLIRDTEEKDRPNYLFIENVKNLLSVNRGYDFLKLLIELDEIGYDAEWQVINSKNFGVPHNRERVFIIGRSRGRSTRKIFPIGANSTTINNTEVACADYRYDEGLRIRKKGDSPYLKANMHKMVNDGDLSNAIYVVGNVNPSGNGMNGQVYDSGGLSPTLTTNKGEGPKVLVRAVLTPDRIEKRQNGRRFKEDGEPMFTLTAQDRHGVAIKEKAKQSGFDGYRIRKLTPKECFRLQGFPDEYFERAKEVCSDSQLYKQAGNGVTVNVIYEIAKRL